MFKLDKKINFTCKITRLLQIYMNSIAHFFFQSPTFTVAFVLNERDQYYMYRGGQSALWVDIHLPKGSFFPEMIIDTVVPMADNLPVYEFCYQRVKIKHMGSNLKCVETPEANFEVRDNIAGP